MTINVSYNVIKEIHNMDRERNIVHYPPAPPEDNTLEELRGEIGLLREAIARLTGQAPAGEA